jgi:uncharacterized protein (TIGR03435 family)
MNSQGRLSGALLLLSAAAAFGDGPQIGNPAPPLNLEQVLQAPAGTDATWEKLRGKVVVLDFWATWCGPCVESIPHWNDLADSFKEKPVQFIAITDENMDVVLPFLKRKPIHSWIGLEGVSATKQAYDIRGIPTTVLVNQTGMVVAVTHPKLLKPEHIQEVLDTGASSIPKRSRSSEATEPERVPVTKPRFEISVRRSGPLPSGRGYNGWSTGDNEDKGEYADVRSAILHLFKVRKSMLDSSVKLSSDQYDFTIVLPDSTKDDRDALLRGMFRSAFGLDVRREDVMREVHVLKKMSTNAPGLNPAKAGKRGGGGPQLGSLNLDNGQIRWTTSYLESWLGRPVVDETGDTNRYDIRLKWKLSKAEQLMTAIDRKVLRAAAEPNPEHDRKLSAEQKREAAALRGELSEAELSSFPEAQRENIRIFRAEMAKPEDDRFAPEPAAILTAVKEQWGLKLVPERRMLPGVVVTEVTRKANEP